MFKTGSIIIIITTILTGCFSLAGGGENTVIKEVGSPDRTQKATLFLKEGGATVSNSYQVSILPADDNISSNEVGNTFTVDENNGAAWLKDSSINFIWKGNDTVFISYDKKLRTFIQETKVGRVTVIYQQQ